MTPDERVGAIAHDVAQACRRFLKPGSKSVDVQLDIADDLDRLGGEALELAREFVDAPDRGAIRDLGAGAQESAAAIRRLIGKRFRAKARPALVLPPDAQVWVHPALDSPPSAELEAARLADQQRRMDQATAENRELQARQRAQRR